MDLVGAGRWWRRRRSRGATLSSVTAELDVQVDVVSLALSLCPVVGGGVERVVAVRAVAWKEVSIGGVHEIGNVKRRTVVPLAVTAVVVAVESEGLNFPQTYQASCSLRKGSLHGVLVAVIQSQSSV